MRRWIPRFDHTNRVSQEIILHTLFESGVTRVGDLEQYIQGDVVRCCGRLSELGKKLNNTYQEIASPVQSCLPCSLAHDLTEERRRRNLWGRGQR
jgi:hypothetical protein